MSRKDSTTLGGGCFWCLEAVFEMVSGVSRVQSGYTGGHVTDPSYRQVCGGSTGHTEVVQIAFNADIITFRELLEIFFVVHDPTTLNRQGNDVGTQYRSAIFHHTDGQRETALDLIRGLDRDGPWVDPIVTELAPLEAFYPAEEYHDRYFERNGEQPYCQVVIAPKIAKFREHFMNQGISPT
ncbi:MAG: peptide-methionine (S)-S-oxide reductase MsrA [bacterium]|jgi:peptide-methionine (S)-S-oxide reductase|nr:peptide-methionine (S)-S-oxide reductase MsrA [Gemmatimonadota bacterium]HIL89500.1 peptide-methionine (S)-S-oxide reductase [Gemmatimonadota bacterium]